MGLWNFWAALLYCLPIASVKNPYPAFRSDSSARFPQRFPNKYHLRHQNLVELHKRFWRAHDFLLLFSRSLPISITLSIYQYASLKNGQGYTHNPFTHAIRNWLINPSPLVHLLRVLILILKREADIAPLEESLFLCFVAIAFRILPCYFWLSYNIQLNPCMNGVFF